LKIGFTFFIVLLCNLLSAQGNSNAEKIQLIQQLKIFLRSEIKLNLNNDFYDAWDNRTTTNYLLYISSSQTVKSINNRPFIFFGEDEKSALKEKTTYDSLGYETLLYKSNNTISTKLSNSLLNFPSESIVFIVIHEAVHQHLKGKSVPYIIEEAACDLVANYASIAFIEKNYSQLYKKAKKQKKLNEKFYKNINDAQKLADIALYAHKEQIYHSADKKIKNLIKRGNDLHRDRFNYGINNAFFVRYENYSKNYFVLKQKFIDLKSFEKFMVYIEQMAEKKPKIIDTIR
jgi:hypothetical protein